MAGGRWRACVLLPGAAGGRRGGWGKGAGRNAAELLPPQQPPPQRRGHVVWCMGRGEEEEGVEPREETGERHHTHTAQDGRRGSSTPSCQAFCRGRGARRPARSCSRAACRPAGAKRPWLGGEAGRAPGWKPARQRRPGRPGPRRGKRRCGSGRRGSPGPQRPDPYGREARAGALAWESGTGDQEGPAAAFGPGNLQD
ncbi:collagen alpha-1(I) chain-like [Muntiacus reevesi]|uniref:collagen alpha-1(I) chain-like n=1 Tax=Muntiacus reevesi TaxID=9886 RepID=UPI003306EAA7